MADARASMELFKRVQSDWETEVEERKTKSSKSNNSLLKRQLTEENVAQQRYTGGQCAKRPRLDSESMLFLSDNYWPDDIHVCWF